MGLGNGEGEPSLGAQSPTEVGHSGRLRESGGGWVSCQYLQRSSRTLPGISRRFVSMLRTRSRRSASQVRAAGTVEQAALRLRPEYTGTLCPDPEAGRRRGAEPGGHAPSSGKAQCEAAGLTPARASPMRRLFIGPWAPISLQAAEFLLRRSTSRRL